MDKRSKLTKDLLYCISLHAANSRKLYRKEYYVVICKRDAQIPQSLKDVFNFPSEQSIRMYPIVSVFPDPHRRKQSDKIRIVNHVIKEHFKDELYLGEDEFGNVLLDSDKIVPGTYKYSYRLNIKGGRHWTRIR